MKWLDNEQMYSVRNASPKNWFRRKKLFFYTNLDYQNDIYVGNVNLIFLIETISFVNHVSLSGAFLKKCDINNNNLCKDY